MCVCTPTDFVNCKLKCYLKDMFSLLAKIKTGLMVNPVEIADEQKETDYEADGFLLIGETEAEKAKAYGRITSVSNMSPIYGQNAAAVESSKMLKSNVENTNKDCFFEHHTPCNISPLNGIPFKLSPHLEIISKYSDFEIHSIPHENISLQKYHYDFSFEKSLLRDLDQSGDSISSTSFLEQQDLITF
ncbi:uncharacterized protein LOC106870225 isoform X2 [Octopus bimaculoides]|uniref:uncharacterized protein LOC106870225 isoform X2 n=1 Tax=Octopus bimaculoides TaxID=37653 RepID=UPI0022DF7B34|nr:uncharacterized protein LOC106870225 isoform X2 [Octopus bimaculoides]